MIDYIYEVRGTHDPIDGDRVVFTNKQEALDYADNYKEAEVYLVQLEVDDFNGVPTKTAEVQIRGPEVSVNLADETIPNSCDADNPDCYDQDGNFRYPEYDDDLDDELVDDFEEGYDDRRGHDPINRRERVNMEEVSVDESLSEDAKESTDQYVKLVNDSASKYHPNQAYDLNDIKHLFKDCDTTKKRFSEKEINLIAKFDNHCKVIRESDKGMLVTVPCYYRDPKDRAKILDTPKYIEVWAPKSNTKPITESFEDDDDMTDQEFAEALYNALADKREQEVFPEDKLDMDPPADDVPVVKCKITPLATHSEDEKPLNEEDSVSSDLDAAIDQ